jgi:Mnd1 HTH domain
MASKKGLSEAEKRTRMSEIFTSVPPLYLLTIDRKGDFYTFKEIEKIATQQKKIVPQSVKEVLQSLVDDNLVSGASIPRSERTRSFQIR